MSLPTINPAELTVAASAKRKAYLHVLLPLFITSVIAYLDRVNLSFAALQMNADLNFSPQVYGFGAGIFYVGYVLFEIPGALIAEKYSPKWWLARIMITWGALTVLVAFVTTEWQFYVVRFLLGIAEASLYPVLYASCIPRWFSSADRPRALAVLLTSLQFSSIIGAPLSGWLLGLSLWGFKGWQMLFILEGIPAILFAFVLVRWVADSPEKASWLTAAEKQVLSKQYQHEIALKEKMGDYTVLQALTEFEVLKLSLTYFLWITGFWGFGYWMPSVLQKISGASNQMVGWLIVIPMSLSLLTMLWIGDHAAKTGEKRWHGAIGLFIGAIGLWCGTWTTEPRLAFVFMCLAGIGVYAPFGVWWSYPTTFLSGPAAAGAIGLINSMGNLGGFVGPSIIGYLEAKTGGHESGWWYLAVSLALAGCLILTLRRHDPNRMSHKELSADHHSSS